MQLALVLATMLLSNQNTVLSLSPWMLCLQSTCTCTLYYKHYTIVVWTLCHLCSQTVHSAQCHGVLYPDLIALQLPKHMDGAGASLPHMHSVLNLQQNGRM